MTPPLTDDLRQLSRGWRWTRRPLTPRSAEPWLPPAVPREFPTDWARSPVGRAVGRVLFDFGMKPLAWATTAPRTEGLDQLEGLRPPVVFVKRMERSGRFNRISSPIA